MKWLGDNLASISAAALLAVLTWTLLYSEKTNTIATTAVFQPVVRTTEVGAFRYYLPSGEIRPGDKFPLSVTGPRDQLEAMTRNLACAPVLEDSAFPADKLGEKTLALALRDFNLPNTVGLPPLSLRVAYSRLETLYLPVRASMADLADSPRPGFRVERIRVEPSSVRVRVPQHLRESLKELPIRPIHIGSHIETFPVRGVLDAEAAPDVRLLEDFSIEVFIAPIPFEHDVADVPLRVSAAGPGPRIEGATTVKVRLSGPEDLVRRITAAHLHAYVIVPEGLAAGRHELPVQCDLLVEEWRPRVRVVALPEEKPERRVAAVLVPAK